LPYGYWINPNGELLTIATANEGHYNALQAAAGHTDYNKAFKEGWIRVHVGPTSLGVSGNRESINSPKIKNIIQNIFEMGADIWISNIPEHYRDTEAGQYSLIVEYITGPKLRDRSFDSFYGEDELRKFFGKQLKIASTPYGYWITPDGELIEVEYQQHAAVMARKFNIYSYQDAFAKGFIRIVTETSIPLIELNASHRVNEKQREAIKSIILRNKNILGIAYINYADTQDEYEPKNMYELDAILKGKVLATN